MAIDVLVMPVWRFKVGNFETQLERLAEGKLVYTTGSGHIGGRERFMGFLARRRARREVLNIRNTVSNANGHLVDWLDEGPVVLSEQLHTESPLTSYLWWLDRRDVIPEYIPPPGNDYDRHPFYQIKPDRPSTLTHLGSHPFHNAYWLPVDFAVPVNVEPYKIFGTWDASKRVVSAIRMRHELGVVNQILRCPEDYAYTEGDPFAVVKVTFRRVMNILDVALRHRLPVIVWA
jgi:hypothetical protein